MLLPPLARALSILNKLAPEKYERLATQALSIKVSTADTLAVIVDNVFDKATTESNFCPLYAKVPLPSDLELERMPLTSPVSQFCARLSAELPEFQSENAEGSQVTDRLSAAPSPLTDRLLA